MCHQLIVDLILHLLQSRIIAYRRKKTQMDVNRPD